MKLTSDRLLDLLNRMHAGVVVIDKDDKIIVFNKLAGEMLNQDPKGRIGTSILLCHPERAEPGVLKMINQMKSGELKEYEGWVNFGGRVLYEYIYPLHDKNGNYIGAVGEMHDGTEKAAYLMAKGEFEMPEMHGLGESSPRSPNA
jgi:PAS domain S-box-containing protein